MSSYQDVNLKKNVQALEPNSPDRVLEFAETSSDGCMAVLCQLATKMITITYTRKDVDTRNG